MKLAFYDDFKLGVLRSDELVDVSDVAKAIGQHPGDRMNGLIADFASYRPAVEAAARSGKAIPLASVRLRPPLLKPTNIVCMAANYMEDGTRKEPAPINAFLKPANTIIGHGDTMILPDVPATVFEGEAEIALVIGRRAQNVSEQAAMSHVFGYMNFIDGSARGLPPSGNTFYQMKARATFTPIGPFLVTADEIADPLNLQVKLWVNGGLKQKYNTSDMAHKIPHCLSWASSVHPLEVGDVIALGTNHRGLSAFHDGDTVELETEGLGRLSISVKDDLGRTWSRETRLERMEKGLDSVAPQLSGKYQRSS